MEAPSLMQQYQNVSKEVEECNQFMKLFQKRHQRFLSTYREILRPRFLKTELSNLMRDMYFVRGLSLRRSLLERYSDENDKSNPFYEICKSRNPNFELAVLFKIKFQVYDWNKLEKLHPLIEDTFANLVQFHPLKHIFHWVSLLVKILVLFAPIILGFLGKIIPHIPDNLVVYVIFNVIYFPILFIVFWVVPFLRKRPRFRRIGEVLKYAAVLPDNSEEIK